MKHFHLGIYDALKILDVNYCLSKMRGLVNLH